MLGSCSVHQDVLNGHGGGGVVRVVLPPPVPPRYHSHRPHGAEKGGAACSAGLSGLSPDKFTSRMDLRGSSIAPDELCIGYYDQRLIALGAVARQCSETTPDASLRRHPLRRRA